MIWDYVAFRCRPVSPLLNAVDGIVRYFIEVYHLSLNVRQRWFFAKEKTAAGNAMQKRQGGHRQAAIFVYHLRLLGIYWMKRHFKGRLSDKEINLILQYRLKLCRSINVQGGGSA